jgi:uncharacterized protein YdcH (DUF465 family)
MMRDDLDTMLRVMVHMYFRIRHKAPNYSTTYTKPALEDFNKWLNSRVMYLMCAEVQKEKQELHEWMVNQQDSDQEELDKMAQNDLELKDSINMSIDTKIEREMNGDR